MKVTIGIRFQPRQRRLTVAQDASLGKTGDLTPKSPVGAIERYGTFGCCHTGWSGRSRLSQEDVCLPPVKQQRVEQNIASPEFDGPRTMSSFTDSGPS